MTSGRKWAFAATIHVLPRPNRSSTFNSLLNSSPAFACKNNQEVWLFELSNEVALLNIKSLRNPTRINVTYLPTQRTISRKTNGNKSAYEGIR